eukprot:5708893-Prymnesium_polylepis.1
MIARAQSQHRQLAGSDASLRRVERDALRGGKAAVRIAARSSRDPDGAIDRFARLDESGLEEIVRFRLERRLRCSTKRSCGRRSMRRADELGCIGPRVSCGERLSLVARGVEPGSRPGQRTRIEARPLAGRRRIVCERRVIGLTRVEGPRRVGGRRGDGGCARRPLDRRRRGGERAHVLLEHERLWWRRPCRPRASIRPDAPKD